MNLKTLIQNSSFYSLISILQKGTNFLLIPVLTLYLTTEDYGIVTVVSIVNAFLNVFYLVALHGSINRFYYEYNNDPLLQKKLLGTIISVVLINSTFLTILFLITKDFIIQPLIEGVDFYPFIAIGMISVFFNPCFTIFQSYLQASQKGKAYSKNNILFFITNLGLLLFSVIKLKLGAIGVIGSLALTNIVFFIYSFIVYQDKIILTIDKKLLKRLLKYSIPIIPHSLSGVTTNFIDRILINKLMSTSSAGIYSVGNNFGSIVFMIAQAINQAFVPWFNQAIKMNETKKIPLISKVLILFYCFCALGISFFGKEIIAIITPIAYHKSYMVIPFISFAFVFHGVYYFFAGALFYDIKGRGNRIIPITTISSAALNVVLNLVLIPKWGMLGASIATLITKILLSFSLKFFYKRYIDISYPEKFLLLVPMVFFFISLLTFSDKMTFLIKASIYLILITIVFYQFKKELNSLLKMFNK